MTRNSDTLSAKSAPWKVTYQGGFWDSHGRAGNLTGLTYPNGLTGSSDTREAARVLER